jgi:hypothetical protein
MTLRIDLRKVWKVRNKLLAFSSLFLVFACAAFNYRFYGVNTNDVDQETLKQIKLIAGLRTDRNRDMSGCIPGVDNLPTCIVVSTDEFRLMRQEIIECRTEKK